METDRKQQAKAISLLDLLSKLGHYPAKAYNDSSSKIWFNSPFRGENQSSFIYFPANNSWYDWGNGKGGDIIDFVKDYNECTFREAIDYLLSDGVPQVKHVPPKNIDLDKQGIGIVDIQEITNPYLIRYANSRAIDTDLLRRYCKEVHYCYHSWDHITHMAIGFQNDKGGWELRNHKQKVGNAPKTWRTIRGRHDSNQCNVFEGFFDFLSHLQLMGWDTPLNDTFVMNSLVYSPFIKDESEVFEYVNLYLDNDAAADQKIKDYFTGEKYNDVRGEYHGFEDYNDFVKFKLLKQHGQQV